MVEHAYAYRRHGKWQVIRIGAFFDGPDIECKGETMESLILVMQGLGFHLTAIDNSQEGYSFAFNDKIYWFVRNVGGKSNG